ncbi:MAG: hypothetical protein DIU78_022775 [Pseudomonadota bacterium]|nr:MAG: hypothetical protein DIU78_17075 [Pseudomonadota bacterium]
MISDRQTAPGIDPSLADLMANAHGTLRDALGALRNLAQLLQSRMVAPKSLASVLPDALEACGPMRISTYTLLDALGTKSTVLPARAALEAFFSPRLAELEAALAEAMKRPLGAAARLKLEEVVLQTSFEFDAGRELLQMLEDAAFGRTIRVDPCDLVRAFARPPSVHAEGREVVCAIMSTHDFGEEIEINPRMAVTLVTLGIELVGRRAGSGEPNLSISGYGSPVCTIRIKRKPLATGEPLLLTSRGIIQPTVPCLRAAAELSGGRLEWDEASSTFSLSYANESVSRCSETA